MDVNVGNNALDNLIQSRTQLNPFKGKNFKDDVNQLNTTNNKFTSKVIEDKVTQIIKNNTDISNDDKTTAILKVLKENNKIGLSEDPDGIFSADFLKNFNASILIIKDPVLRNTMRKELSLEISQIKDAQLNHHFRNLQVKREWGEIAYESSVDKFRENSPSIKKELENLINSSNQKDINKFVTKRKEEFGSIENLNKLFTNAGIEYRITGTENDYKIEPSTRSYQSTREYIIENLNTSEFKDPEIKANAQEEISALANLGRDDIKADKYTDENLKSKFDLLTKAYKHNYNNPEEFSKAELNRASINLLSLARANEKDNIEASKKAEQENPTGNTNYKDTFSDEILKLNSIRLPPPRIPRI